MTMGVGREIWEQFGHNAIWIHDAVRHSDVVYNWGLFDFRAPHFVAHFLQGRMLYSMGGFDLPGTIEEYRERDRSVWVQELNLSPAQRRQLRANIEWNDSDGHRDYFYNYFTDNCSTRVRDMLDAVVKGQLKSAAKSDSTNTTFRWHALRLTQSNPAMATGIDIGLGRFTDHRLSTWEAMFLPMTVRDFLRSFRVTDSTGAPRPLVKSERMLYTSTRYREPREPPRFLPYFLVFGVVVASILFLAGRRPEGGGRGAHVAAAILVSLWSLLCGILGLLLTLLWTVTDHTAAHHNENLLLFNPAWLLLVVVGPLMLLRGRPSRTARVAAYAVAASSVIALLMHVVGLSRQDNGALIALTLPAALVIARLAWLPSQRRSLADSSRRNSS